MTSQIIQNRSDQQWLNDWVSRVIIRPANESDLPGLEWDGEYAHFRKLYANAYQRCTNGTAVLWVAELNGSVEDPGCFSRVEDPGCFTRVEDPGCFIRVEDPGCFPRVIIGQVFIQFICDRPELADGFQRAYLYSFRIQPQFRRAGLGSRVLQVVEKDLCQRGFRYVTLNVAKTNVDAQRLYFRCNYRIVAHEPGVWSYPDQFGVLHNVEEPAWRMEKNLVKKAI